MREKDLKGGCHDAEAKKVYVSFRCWKILELLAPVSAYSTYRGVCVRACVCTHVPT